MSFYCLGRSVGKEEGEVHTIIGMLLLCCSAPIYPRLLLWTHHNNALLIY